MLVSDTTVQAFALIREKPDLAAEVAKLMRNRSARMSLTSAQRRCLEFIRSYVAEHDGVGPSYRELAKGLELCSTSGVHRLVTALESRGWLTRIAGSSRAIKLREVSL